MEAGEGAGGKVEALQHRQGESRSAGQGVAVEVEVAEAGKVVARQACQRCDLVVWGGVVGVAIGKCACVRACVRACVDC